MAYKKILGLLFSALFIFGPTALHAGTSMLMHLEKGLLSAELKDVPLKEVFQYVQDASGIWFRGDESLLEQEVSTNFEKMELDEGLRRILFSLNHAMIFDAKGNLAGVFLAGRTLAESGDRFLIYGNPLDSSTQDPIPQRGDFPDHPGDLNGKSEMPDDDMENMQAMPSDNMDGQEYMMQKDPSAHEPSGGCPGEGRKPETGPDPRSSDTRIPPM